MEQAASNVAELEIMMMRCAMVNSVFLIGGVGWGGI